MKKEFSPAAHPLHLLRLRDFRRFWFAQIAQACGLMMFQFTLGWLAFEITGSPAKLAFIHLCAFAPQIVLTLVGGVLADRWDPRRLIAIAESLSALAIFALGFLTLAGEAQYWHLALCAFVIGVTTSIDEPSRSSFFPRLLPDRAMLPAAIPLISMAWGGTRIVAPSIAGFAIAAFGADISFLAAACGTGMMVIIICSVQPVTTVARTAHGGMLDNFIASVRYVRANALFLRVILAAMLNASFAMGYVYMLPVFAKEILAVDARDLGILSSAAGVGSITGLFTYAKLQASTSPRNIMVYAVTLLNIALIVFSWSDWFWLSVCMVAVAGLSHSYFLTGTQVILQTLVEDQFRGRVMALFSLVWCMMVLSGFLLNFAAAYAGPRWALCGGALAVLCFVWLSLARFVPLREVTLAKGQVNAQ